MINYNKQYFSLFSFSEMDHAEWLAALLLSANAQLPAERAANGSNGQAAAAAGEINGGDGGPAGLRKSATIGERKFLLGILTNCK
jgi:hypothetical protein